MRAYWLAGALDAGGGAMETQGATQTMRRRPGVNRLCALHFARFNVGASQRGPSTGETLGGIMTGDARAGLIYMRKEVGTRGAGVFR